MYKCVMQVVDRVGGAMEDMYRTIKFPQVWKPSLFMFLSLALSYSTHEGHFYWYTDPIAGPGFSKVNHLLRIIVFLITATSEMGLNRHLNMTSNVIVL